MELKIEHEKNKNRFVISDEENAITGSLNYHMEKTDLIIIDYVEVHRSHRGKGMGAKLVDALMKYAKELGCKVDSRCSYASSVIYKNRDKYKEMLRE
ncbi:MAG: N-acetyltransferase [Eubacteriaceae bacterium]|nr:N-acetyltransferase [Eubacteriaceae bacterium]